MKKIIQINRFMVMLVAMFTLSLTNAFATDYTSLFSINCTSVVTGGTYQAYMATVDQRGWVVTFGGGSTHSVATNSGNRTKCVLGDTYAKYAITNLVSKTDIATAFVSTTSISDVSKISYTFNGGSNQTSTKVYLIYSSNNTTFDTIPLISGTQGATISSGTAYEFAKKTGYFGLLFKCTNSTGNWRIDNVEITFYKESTPDPKIVVVYDLQGHGEAIKNDTIESGSKITKPAAPEAVGYEFRNWFTDAKSLGTAFDFNQAVTADNDTTITIYAKWRNPAAWEQFKKDLDKYSYVEYDSTYEAGFMIHLATTQDAQVQPLTDAAFIEASEEVLANYDFRTFTTTIVALYPAMNDELGKCTGVESPSTLIAAYTQLPYRANGLNAVCGLYTSYFDLVYKAWAETNYDTDTEICKCMLNSDVFFKATAKLMEAFDASEK